MSHTASSPSIFTGPNPIPSPLNKEFEIQDSSTGRQDIASQESSTNVPKNLVHDATKDRSNHLYRTQLAAQLKEYIADLPTLSNLPSEDPINMLLDTPGHALFQQIFAALLLNYLWHTTDLQDNLLLFMSSPGYTPYMHRRFGFHQNPPTHFMGLCQMPDSSVLLWGELEFVGSETLDLRFTFYDSWGIAATDEFLDATPSYTDNLMRLLRGALTPSYTINTAGCQDMMFPIPEDANNLPNSNHWISFCQIMSRVLHDEDLGTPTLWPSNIMKQRIRMLLGQVLSGDLSLERVLSSENPDLPRVILHGDIAEMDPSPPIDNWEPTIHDIGDNDVNTEYDEDNNHDFEEDVTNLEAETDGLADIEAHSTHTCYVRVGDTITFQNSTPSDVDPRNSPPHRPSIALGDNNNLMENQSYVEVLRDLLFEQRWASPLSRLSYWKQLKGCNPSFECVTVLTLHLWFSSLLAGQKFRTLYIDPILAEKLLRLFKDDPLGLEAEQIPELLDRQNLWPGIGEVSHVVVLAHLDDILGPGLQGWILLDITVEYGRVVETDLLLPSFRTYNVEVFTALTTQLIGALNCVLPRPKLVQHSSVVMCKSRSILLPQPHTGESLILAMIAHLCGKLLNQTVKSVNIGAIRQSICLYYSQSLRSHKVDDSFPWTALTDLEGRLRTVEIPKEFMQHRLSLEVNREPSPFEAFPRQQSHTLSVASPGPSSSFFVELAQPQTTHPQGMLVGTRGRSVESFDKCVFYGAYPSWPDKFPYSHLQKSTAYSIIEFVDLIHALGGPEDPRAHHLLTMSHAGRRVTLDWLKDIMYPEPEYLLAGWDLDSLTATFFNVPKILRTGAYYPYANWGLTMTSRNELVVRVDGNDIDMHSCPNICLMTFGTNNRFRLLACYPGKRGKIDGTSKLWHNIPNEPESWDWFDIFHTALLLISEDIPPHWEHALEKTIEGFPDTYDIAKGLCSPTGQARSFITVFIEPELLNLIFKKMRFVVDTTARFALYRGYFFHLCGMNLKLGTQHIHGREDTHPLNHAFQMNDFFDWTTLNSNDIVADVGLAVNVRRACAPLQFQRSTLLIHYGPLRELLLPGFKTPVQEHYLHSHVISGCHALPYASTKDSGVIKVQVYHKDMLLTHKDKEHNLGANWTVDQALVSSQKFTKQIAGYQNNIAQANTFGVRVEHRLTAWGADRLMQLDAEETLRRLLRADIIACHSTASVSALKLTLSKTYTSIIRRQTQLPRASIRSPEVMLLTCVLAYLLRGLVRRPDPMSDSNQMVHRLSLTTGAEEYGHPFLRGELLDDNGLRMDYHVQAHTFKILSRTNVIVPGGQTFKTSQLQVDRPPQPPRQRRVDQLYPVRPLSLSAARPRSLPHVCPPSPPTTPLQAPREYPLWPDASQNFLDVLLNIHLPAMMWSLFPNNDKAEGTLADTRWGKPFKKSHWPTVVEPFNTLKFVNGKYMATFNRLFPQNWKVKSADGDFKRYDQEFLVRIRDHIDSSIPDVRKTAYSAELRRRIRTSMLAQWEYLPVAQAKKMWPFQEKQGERFYRISDRYSKAS